MTSSLVNLSQGNRMNYNKTFRISHYNSPEFRIKSFVYKLVINYGAIVNRLQRFMKKAKGANRIICKLKLISMQGVTPQKL